MKIKSIKELKKLACGHNLECHIRLNYGLKSSKEIEYNPLEDEFGILHLIDGTEELITTKELRKTNIGEAIRKGAFYTDDNANPKRT